MATTQDETIAELQRANAELRQERDAALAQKAALAEVLGRHQPFSGRSWASVRGDPGEGAQLSAVPRWVQ